MIPSSNSAPFEQGDNIPKYYGGFQDIRSSHLPTFMVKVSEIIAKHQEPNKEHDFKLAFVPRKTEEYHSDIFSAAMHQTFPPLVVVIFLIPFMNFFQKALEEKVHKIREYMRMMGMKDSAYTASWVVYYVLQIFVIWIELAVITRIYLTPNSNIFLVFLFYFMYGLSLFGWIIGLVALFNNVKTGSAAAIIIHFATYYIVHAIPKAATYSTRCLASLFPNLAMNQGSEIMWKLEEQGIGLSFSTISMTFKNYNFMTYFMMWTINFFLAILIGTYLSYILPTEYGIRKHPWFWLMPSFWSRKRRGTNSRIISIDLRRNTPVKEFSYLKLKEEQKLNNFDNDLEMVSQDFNNFEPVSVHIQNKEKLELKSLVKVYDNGVKAVDNLSLTMYKDQIFALLGPNGAGKTSTISMITGLYEATQGSAHIYDINIFEEMDQVREILGV